MLDGKLTAKCLKAVYAAVKGAIQETLELFFFFGGWRGGGGG